MNEDGSQRGMHKGAAAPLVGGAACAARASVVCWRVTCFAAWGEPARPGLPPEGETEKGEIKLPCCRRLNAVGVYDSLSVPAVTALVRQLRGPHLSTCP